jgi:hypothetical protein
VAVGSSTGAPEHTNRDENRTPQQAHEAVCRTAKRRTNTRDWPDGPEAEHSKGIPRKPYLVL